jgi:hypothetical protein
MHKRNHPLQRLQRLLRNTRGSRPKAHAIEDDGARQEPPVASLPSMMLFGAAQWRKRRRTDEARRYPSSASAASAVACSCTSAARARVIADGSSCWMTLRP